MELPARGPKAIGTYNPKVRLKNMKLPMYIAVLLSAISNPVASQTNTPALRATEMFFESCVAPLMLEQEIVTDGLDPLPSKTALSLFPNSRGEAWMAKDAHVGIAALQDKTGTLDGCSVSWHAAAAAGREIDSQFVIARFDRWATQKIQSGEFYEISECGERDGKYTRMLETKSDRSPPVRILISTIEDLDFVFMLAAETPASEPHPPCQ